LNDARLDEALTYEREGRFLESLRECLRILGEQPGNVEALALASRLSLLAGDAANAIAYASEAVRAQPSSEAARRALDAASQTQTDSARALQMYREALKIEPGIEHHVAIPGSLAPPARADRAQTLLDAALKLDPGLAKAHAAAANLCVRRGEYLAALGGYQRATFISGKAEYALALSEILFTLNDHNGANFFRERALAQQRFFTEDARGVPGRRNVLALMTPGPWPLNTPLDFAIDPSRVRLTRLYLSGAPVRPQELEPFDVIFNAIGEAQDAQGAIQLAKTIALMTKKRVLNDPAQSWKTSRTHLAAALAGVAGCLVPQAQRVTREQLQSCTVFPSLARPVDAHGGRGLVKLQNATGIADYLREHNEPEFDITPFIEYRSADGYYRKYRVALVGGVPYPYHLAISPEWMVHYIGSPTGETPWMQSEEERFLSDPRSVFPLWNQMFGEIAGAIGLDYFAIDCSLLPDGRVLIFEADIASLIHCREPAGSYKHRYVPAIFTALDRLLSS
jgi:tetratricopeptide (TPR) repeat protein